MLNYVFELGLEELPARFCKPLEQAFYEGMKGACESARLAYADMQVYTTPRRLVLMTKIAERQSDDSQTLFGPPVAVAYTETGELSPAGRGFLKKAGVESSDLKRVKDAKGRDVLSVKKLFKGEDVALVLPRLLKEVIHQLPMPVAMTWGQGDHVFVRPVRWILSVLDSACLPLTLFAVQAANMTYGQRFLSATESMQWLGKGIKVSSAAVFFDLLRDEGRVTLKRDDRAAHIKQLLLAEKQLVDLHWLEEVSNLTENPCPFIDRIDQVFLRLPDAVIETCLKKHQKYFALKKEDGTLRGDYLLVAESVTADNEAQIRAGNAKVLTARLRDALYYLDRDINKGLAHFSEALSTLRYQEALGSMADKQDRLKCLAQRINEKYFKCDQQDINIVAPLLKADLLSLMVQEFANLQGVMGAFYAEEMGLSKSLSRAIASHYMPIAAQAPLPEDALGQLFSIADRVDHIMAAFVTKQQATGSRDPLGIRRAVAAIIRLALFVKLDLDFVYLFEQSNALYQAAGYEVSFALEDLKSFVLQRIKSEFEAQGLAYDVVDTVLPFAYTSLLTAFQRAHEMQRYREVSPDHFKSFVETGLRIQRLLDADHDESLVDEKLFEAPIELEAVKALDHLRQQVMLNNESLRIDLSFYADFTSLMAQYFEQVMVMHQDVRLRQNRLAFLGLVKSFFSPWGQLDKLN
eukprot:COSAG01_NODE_69_length_28801_cov_10.460038_22_plen_691_part_00